MSTIKLRTIRDRVRYRLNEQDSKRSVANAVKVDQQLASSYIALQASLPAPQILDTTSLTISSATFTLPTTASQWTGGASGDGGREYRGDVRIRLQSLGEELVRVNVEEMDAIREGEASAPQGIPRIFCLWEEIDGEVQGRVWPSPNQSYACDLFCTLEADDLRDFIGFGSDDMDDVEAMLSRQGALALELHAAAELLSRMTPEDAGERRLDKGVANDWKQEGNRLLYREAMRRHSVRSIGRGMRMVG